MSVKQTIFLTGATGYIGGSVLWRLLNHKDAKNFNINLLVRDPSKAKLLQEKFGVEAIVGSHSDADKIEALAEQADCIIATADADNLGAAKAIFRGMKKYYKKNGKAPIYIHTSGTGVLSDNAAGMYASEKIYDDSKVEDIESLDPKTQIHREIDMEAVSADQAGYARTYIILPSNVYGIAKNGLTEAGVQNPHSILIPVLVRASIDRGQGGMVGLGKNKWPNVHIDDVADLYIVLFDKIRADVNSVPHGREGFYFGASGEHDLYEVGKAVAQALVELGRGKSPEPTTFTKEELDKYFGGSAVTVMGSNSRCVANRSLALGWKPKHTTKDFLASVKPEIEALIAAGKHTQEENRKLIEALMAARVNNQENKNY
ncbi:NAD-binding protein [Fomitiporia mediterranea MF3/22]|uniref:NAD-binding protein n=1 Tax=Fomitiporia mediterranea (strain MF3/22) TaxID=694068 RepID=UPI0004409796|nr:NAD-binding protein [Fomitiporia mediterranea MF3/22]EJD06863.1 NAD-binding protein [Fomitiporia mediterranea MF3/22]